MAIRMEIGKPVLAAELDQKSIRGIIDRRVELNQDYENLENKPSINGITIQGEMTAAELNLSEADAVVTSFNGQTGAVTYTAPVLSVNGQTGAVTLNIPTVPTDVSAFNNDAGYITASQAPVQSVNGSTGDITGLATSSELTDGLAGKQDAGDYATAAAGDTAAIRAASIPFGKVDSTSTSTAYTATVPGITSLYDGVACYLMNGVVTSASGFTVDINGLGALPVYSTLAAASRATTLFNVNYTLLLVYNSQRVEGGCWDAYYGYDSNTNTLGYQIRTNSSSLPASDKFYRYRLLFTSADGTKWVPANTSNSTNATAARTVNSRPIDPHGAIVYYGTTTAIEADALVTAAQIWQQYTLTLGYSFNRTGAALVLPYPKPIYVKCTPQADGSAIIDPDDPYVTALPTTDDGKIYIFLGRTYSATSIELTLNHPVYYFKNGAIRSWTGPV